MVNQKISRVKRYAPSLPSRRERVALFLGVVWFMVLLSLFIWLGWQIPSGVGKEIFLIFASLLLALLLYALCREWRYCGQGRERCALMVGADGLWPAHLERDVALVRWGDIDDAWYDLGPARGALVLQGKGRNLLRVDRRLVGYEILCAQIFSLMQRPLPPLLSSQIRPKPGSIGQLFLRWAVPGFVLLSVVLLWGLVRNAVIGVMLLVCTGLFIRRSLLVETMVDEQGVMLVYQGFYKPAAYRWDDIDNLQLQPRHRGPVLDLKLLLKNGQAVLLRGYSGDLRRSQEKNKFFPCMDGYRLVLSQLPNHHKQL